MIILTEEISPSTAADTASRPNSAPVGITIWPPCWRASSIRSGRGSSAPALSTITQPNRDIGRASVELLVGALADDRKLDPQHSVLLAHGFRVGESCGIAPH